MKIRFSTLFKLLLTLGLIYFLYTRIEDPAQLWQKLTSANPWLLLAALVCYAGAVATGAIKWGILLQSAGIVVQRTHLLRYQWIAEFFNNVVPGQVGGDMVRGVALAADTQRRADAAASVLIDRFIGLMVFTLAATIAASSVLLWGRPNGIPFAGDQVLYMQIIALGSGLATVALLTLVSALLSRRLKTSIDQVLVRLPLLSRLSPIWQKLSASFNTHRTHFGALLRSALGSAIIVLLTSTTLWLVAEAIAAGHVSLVEMLIINPMIVFALIAPISPGGLGVRQVSLGYLFLLLGADYSLGVAVGLVQQVLAYVVSIPGGLLWLLGKRGGQ